MNLYGMIILFMLFFEYILNFFADFLNLKNLETALPEEMVGTYDPEDYRKSQEYTRVTTGFGRIVASFMLILTLGFWFLGGFEIVDQWLRSWDLSRLFTGVLYIGVLSIFQSLLMLPFSLYRTFVIEERFGFNKTTLKLFFIDKIKGALLAIMIGVPVLALLLAFLEWGGAYAWVYAWAALSSLILLIQAVAPIWIMPLFNKFEPLASGELKDAIMAFARSVQFPLQNVFVMDGSKRSSKSNAFFTGFGKNKRIALFDTLIDAQSPPELIAVLAHEIGHYKKKHITQGLVIAILQVGLMFYLLSIFLSHPGLYAAFFVTEPSVYAGLLFFGMLYRPIEFVLSLFMNRLSRKNEYEADHFAAESIASPENLVKSLKKLSVNNLSNLTPHPLYVFLNYSHPPLLARIRAIRLI
ncbi:MAG: M48 family metallopeptidase [Nitrospirota bacterium]|nr:M48 family metallopeptidase [Nitrospirota bacterium]